ncbi:MAG TPA: type II toxin-antitoxin system VapC family toxin [Candidatus Saccharimonadales bacterium]|jgi:PIN domain nuclease of toxin-antitoxin system|nr:type II toxin-antitoxin system VapC family toxin [Candidatus Saccharimonadales bacterium]
MAQTRQSLLLDSHVFIWSLEQTKKIGQETQKLLQSGVSVYISKASLWELAIKYKAKKFPYDTKYLLEGIKLSGFSVLDIETDHLQAYPTTQLLYKDPFDLLLVTQAYVEGYMFITADGKILESSYTVQDATK